MLVGHRFILTRHINTIRQYARALADIVGNRLTHKLDRIVLDVTSQSEKNCFYCSSPAIAIQNYV